MSASCCDQTLDPHRGSESYRRVLWAVLAINAAMFAIEVVAGSRRTWLKGTAAFSAAAAMSLAFTAAQAKVSKAAVHYRDYPNGMRMCQNCKFFISAGGGRSGMMGCPMMGGGMMGHGMMGAGACQLVEGRISPMGYCDLYAPA